MYKDFEHARNNHARAGDLHKVRVFFQKKETDAGYKNDTDPGPNGVDEIDAEMFQAHAQKIKGSSIANTRRYIGQGAR